ncbi:hypothetical protein MMJ03_10375, partial [Enterococcus cecorum]|nr:hypothetical protein [Enterococcus cecorum]
FDTHTETREINYVYFVGIVRCLYETDIKDDNITFPTHTDALSEEEVHVVPSKVFSGLFSYPENPYCCPNVG